MTIHAQRLYRRESISLLLLSVCPVVLCLLSSGCGTSEKPVSQEPSSQRPAEKAAPEAPKPEPKAQPISLGALEPVILHPAASATVKIEVQRSGNEGPIKIEAQALPDGISVPPLEIPADQSTGQLKVAAAQKLGDEEFKATFPVKATLGELEATGRLEVTVKKLSLPSFQPAAGVILQPGKTATVNLAIKRNGFQGPVSLRVEGLPAKVTAKVQDIAAGQDGTKLELTAAGDAPDANQPARVVTTLFGRTIDVPVPVQIDAAPYRVNAFKTVTLNPGETNRVEISVERKSYQGPLTLEATKLPKGVTAAKVEFGPGDTKALLEFKVAADARECVRSATIVSHGGNLERSDPMVVRITYGGQGFLPRSITANDELFHLLRRGSFGGRLTTASKQALVDAYGGTPESEEAVLRGLRWLVAHQQPDGHWPLKNYSEGIEGCDCQSEFEKDVVDYNSAGTAFGLLPLLGAGVTHNRAPEEPTELAGYEKNVESGLAFLIKNQVVKKDSPDDGYLGGNMYAHALGSMVLCEAYGLSGDERLKVPAQLAIKYLKEAQHTEGGWRYGRGQAGDLSVTAWVFLAIRSGQLAGLTIDKAPLIRAERFVDSCAVGPEGAKLSQYAYQPGGPPKLSLTAAGLLTRLYLLDWRKDNSDLAAGCKELMKNLPPTSGALGQIYYYHYATQVLHHMEGSDFDLWNYRMREHLLRTQEKQAHKAGSWNPQGSDFGARGGRMYSTAMALLTLEVYYRHLPMFRPVIRVQGTDVPISQ